MDYLIIPIKLRRNRRTIPFMRTCKYCGEIYSSDCKYGKVCEDCSHALKLRRNKTDR